MKTVQGLRDDLQFFGLKQWLPENRELLERLLSEVRAPKQDAERAADQACRHVFDLLGSGPVQLAQTIDWHRDFKSGTRWEPIYFRRIKAVELEDASDIKVPWELSRCYQFVPLGIAYRLTDDEKYAREFARQCQDWIEQNPPYHGVNWYCSMEVAIRAVNWIWGYYLFQDSACFNAEARRRVASSLAIHGEYIWRNLEVAKRIVDGRYIRHNGNHYISDLVGLIYLGMVLPGPHAKRWLLWGMQEIDREMRMQVLPDGAHWELSPSYHRLVLELVLPAMILCEQNQVPVPAAVRQACQAMAEYTMHYLTPDGRCPLVRDADDGRVCRLDGDTEYRDHRHLLALAGVFFDRPDFLSRAGGISAEVIWMLGPAGIEKSKCMPEASIRLESKGFPHAGFYVLRDGEQAHVFVCCADIGMKGTYGGHAHNDCLSFELYWGGRSFITDCGTYTYSADPAARNIFRSTESHNTARVDGVEMNRIVAEELFGMQNDARPKVLEWRSEPSSDYLVAEHYGYARLKPAVVHRRSFRLDRSAKTLQLEDLFEGGGYHVFEVFFHFFPGVDVKELGNLAFLASAGGATVFFKFSGAGWDAKIEPTLVSERYGRKARAWKLVVASRQTAPTKLATMIKFGRESQSIGICFNELREVRRTKPAHARTASDRPISRP